VEKGFGKISEGCIAFRNAVIRSKMENTKKVTNLLEEIAACNEAGMSYIDQLHCPETRISKYPYCF